MHRPRPSALGLPGRSTSESSLPLLSSRESERREHGGLLGHPSSRLRRAGPCAFVLGTLLGLACACLVLAMLALHRGGGSAAVASPQLGDSSPAAAAAAAVLQLGARAASFAEERRGGPAADGGGGGAAALDALSGDEAGDGDTGGDLVEFWTRQQAESWATLRAAALRADADAPASGDAAPSPASSSRAPPGRIAFLFLTRGPLPHARLWHRFFAGAPLDAYAIHVHAAPGFQLNASTVASPLFYDRQIAGSVEVAWGQMSVVDAERRLFAAALADASTQRLVLLSESCVPLRSFAFVQRYLFGSNTSFLDSFHDVQGRYHPALAPTVPASAWRKGTQWCAVTRAHARLFVDDERVFAAMQQHCRTWSSADGQYAQFCAGDEHYKQTLVVLAGRDAEIEHRPVTFANWWPTSRSHPKLYVVQEADAALVRELQTRSEIWRPMEGDHLRCGSWRNESTGFEEPRPCWLFARKFTERAAERLLEEHAALLGLPTNADE